VLHKGRRAGSKGNWAESLNGHGSNQRCCMCLPSPARFLVYCIIISPITICPFNIACFGQLDHTKFPIFRHTHTIEIQLWVSLMMNNEDNEVLQDWIQPIEPESSHVLFEDSQELRTIWSVEFRRIDSWSGRQVQRMIPAGCHRWSWRWSNDIRSTTIDNIYLLNLINILYQLIYYKYIYI
jgi:hypothetical protein